MVEDAPRDLLVLETGDTAVGVPGAEVVGGEAVGDELELVAGETDSLVPDALLLLALDGVIDFGTLETGAVVVLALVVVDAVVLGEVVALVALSAVGDARGEGGAEAF